MATRSPSTPAIAAAASVSRSRLAQSAVPHARRVAAAKRRPEPPLPGGFAVRTA
jgi:hypothetical protein